MPIASSSVESRFTRYPSMTDAQWEGLLLEYCIAEQDPSEANRARIGNAVSEVLDRMIHMERKTVHPMGGIGEVSTIRGLEPGKKFRIGLTASRFGAPFLFGTPFGFQRELRPEAGSAEKPIGHVSILWETSDSSAAGSDPDTVKLPISQTTVWRWQRFYNGLVATYLILLDAMQSGHTFSLYHSPHGAVMQALGENTDRLKHISITYKDPLINKNDREIISKPFAGTSNSFIGSRIPDRNMSPTPANYWHYSDSEGSGLSEALYFKQSMEYEKALSTILRARPEVNQPTERWRGGAFDSTLLALKDLEQGRKTARGTFIMVRHIAFYGLLVYELHLLRKINKIADVYLFHTMSLSQHKMEVGRSFDLDASDQPRLPAKSNAPQHPRFDILDGDYFVFSVVPPGTSPSDARDPKFKGIRGVPRHLANDLGKEIELQEPVRKGSGPMLERSTPVDADYHTGQHLTKTHPQLAYWSGHGWLDRRWFKPHDYAFFIERDFRTMDGPGGKPFINYIAIPDARSMAWAIMQQLNVTAGEVSFADLDDGAF